MWFLSLTHKISEFTDVPEDKGNAICLLQCGGLVSVYETLTNNEWIVSSYQTKKPMVCPVNLYMDVGYKNYLLP